MGDWREQLAVWYKEGKEILYGMFFYDIIQQLKRERAALESLFVLMAFGELLGVPILPPYYSLRLLPYAYPYFPAWKRSLLREKDLTDRIGSG